MSVTPDRLQREAQVGRLPTLLGERVFKGFWPLFFTVAAVQTATWCFPIGSALPYFGDTMGSWVMNQVGIAFGSLVAALAVGIPCARYGIDTVDVSKGAFGVRGSIVPLVAVLASALAWVYALNSMSAQSLAGLIQSVAGVESLPVSVVVVVSLALALVTWVVVVRGPELFERLNSLVVPAVMIIAAIMVVLLISKFGFATVTADVPDEYLITTDPWHQMLLAFELGFAGGASWWPYAGATTRLVRQQKHIPAAFVLGTGIMGSGLIALVAALGASAYGTDNPVVWFAELGGSFWGPVFLGYIVLHNITAIVMLLYIAGIGVQQVPGLREVKWKWLVGVMLLPTLAVSFFTEWVTTHFTTIASYIGAAFTGFIAIGLVDYFILRRQHYSLRGIFTETSDSPYYYWRGINWIAVVVAIGGFGMFLALMNPVDYSYVPAFGFLGASIPTLLVTGVLYYLGMRFIAAPAGKGGLDFAPATAAELDAGTAPEPEPEAEPVA